MGSSSPDKPAAPTRLKIEDFKARRQALSEKIQKYKTELNPEQLKSYENALQEAYFKDLNIEKLDNGLTLQHGNSLDNLNAFEKTLDLNVQDISAANIQKRKAVQETFNQMKSSNAALSQPNKMVAAYVGATNAKTALTNTLTGK